MIAQSALLDREDAENVVVDAGAGRHRGDAAVVPSIADPDLQKVVELNAVKVACGKLQPCAERTVLAEGHGAANGYAAGPNSRLRPGFRARVTLTDRPIEAAFRKGAALARARSMSTILPVAST